MSMFDPRRLRTPHDHPAQAELLQAAQQIQSWAFEHERTLAQQPVGMTASPAVMRELLAEPPPEQGTSFREVFQRFEEQIAPYTLRCQHPRFLAFIPGAPSVPSMLGDWLIAATNFFAGVWLESPSSAQVELTVLDWFKEILGFPKDSRGILTSGGSEANLTALVVAREQLAVEDRSRAVLYVSEQRHRSIDRAAKIMGLFPDQIHLIPQDSAFRLRAAALKERIASDRKVGQIPWLVVANAGATNTGTVDPLEELSSCCRAENLWLHVDAAYGWAANLTEQGKKDLRGIEQADSLTLDPHKWFAQTIDVGCVLIRRGRLLSETFSFRPDYMQDVIPQEEEVNFADHGIALTRRFRALKIWLSVQMLGLNWFRELVERGYQLAQYAEEKLLSYACFEILSRPQLSIICFRYRPSQSENHLNEWNRALLQKLRESGIGFLSSTQLGGSFAIRMCFINWRTTSDDVDLIIDKMMELIPELPKTERAGYLIRRDEG